MENQIIIDDKINEEININTNEDNKENNFEENNKLLLENENDKLKEDNNINENNENIISTNSNNNNNIQNNGIQNNNNNMVIGDYLITMQYTKFLRIPYFKFGNIIHFYCPYYKFKSPKIALSQLPNPPFGIIKKECKSIYIF